MIRSPIGCLVLIFSAALAWAAPRTIHGTVRDEPGYLVIGAHIVLQGAGYEHATASGPDGTFRFEGAPREPLIVAVDAPGFAHFTASVSADSDQLDVVL